MVQSCHAGRQRLRQSWDYVGWKTMLLWAPGAIVLGHMSSLFKDEFPKPNQEHLHEFLLHLHHFQAALTLGCPFH